MVVYARRTCTTYRRLSELLAERGIDVERVELVQRPIVEHGDRAVPARAVEKVLELP